MALDANCRQLTRIAPNNRYFALFETEKSIRKTISLNLTSSIFDDRGKVRLLQQRTLYLERQDTQGIYRLRIRIRQLKLPF